MLVEGVEMVEVARVSVVGERERDIDNRDVHRNRAGRR